ncbi:MAG TPA: histidine phosphatase family protein [Candidatus Dormibacteraeota bacterium]
MGIEIRPARPEPPETGVADDAPAIEEPEGSDAAPAPAHTSPTRLVLVRHGQSTWNREHRIQGQLDPPLSDEGRRQAALLSARLLARLGGRRFAGFYASDLRRAFETAEVIGAALGQAPQPSEGLREIFLGEWEGLRTEEIAERFPEAWASWVEEPDWDCVPGGEGAAAFEARVGSAIEQVLERHPQGDVLMVTHGGVIQIALHRIVGRPSRGLFPFKIQNTSITVIERRDGRMVIGGVNDVGHLEPALLHEVGPE